MPQNPSDNPTHKVNPTTLDRARSLRHTQTPAESKLWPRLRGSRLDGHKFRRQHPIGPYIADFCCKECRLVIEIDGDTHFDQALRDNARTTYLERQGYSVIRFTNNDIHTNLPAVLQAIHATCKEKSTPSRQQNASPRPQAKDGQTKEETP